MPLEFKSSDGRLVWRQGQDEREALDRHARELDAELRGNREEDLEHRLDAYRRKIDLMTSKIEALSK